MKKILLFLLLVSVFSGAQTKQDLGKILTADDSTALLSLASQPDTVRAELLKACTRTEALVSAEALQKNTRQSFRDLIDVYSKTEQEKFWELSRYPSLLSEISNGGKKSTEELEKISVKYPVELRKTILYCGKRHFETISAINSIYNNSSEEFKKTIADYPPQVQTAYLKLLNRPEVLSQLASNLHLATVLGSMFKTDPRQTTHLLDSINISLKKHDEKNIADWKSGLEKNPEAKKEMEQAAKEFSDEYNQKTQVADDIYVTGADHTSQPTVLISPPTVVYVQPYPYWFGYPWWYDYPYWYPYPVWFNTGFYWGPTGVVYLGLPSPFFMNWYFFHPYHHYYYSHYSDYSLGFHGTHYGPRTSQADFNSVIHRWTRANEPNLPIGYLAPDSKRQERIKELGRFEMDYHNNTKGVFGRNLTRSEFLKNNSNYYPRINPVIKQRSFNQPINYPKQQNPIKFNMGKPGSLPGGGLQKPRSGGISKPR